MYAQAVSFSLYTELPLYVLKCEVYEHINDCILSGNIGIFLSSNRKVEMEDLDQLASLPRIYHCREKTVFSIKKILNNENEVLKSFRKATDIF